MNEFDPGRSLDAVIELSTPSSSGYLINEKREDVNVNSIFPDGGMQAWSAIAGAYVTSDMQRKVPNLT